MLYAGQARAQSEELFGDGSSSCATWLYEPGEYDLGVQWVFGYWSAFNIVNQKNHSVGHTTDGRGIIGEVKLECQAHPSEELEDAAAVIYRRLQKAEG